MKYEGLAEYYVSVMLEHSDCTNFVKYRRCVVNNRKGCYSLNFLNDNEQLITFENLYYMNTGLSLASKIMRLNDVSDRIAFTKKAIQRYTDLNVSKYVDTLLTLDYYTRNNDRHLNNMAVIMCQSGYKEAPIFDNGAAFFSNYQIFEPWLTLEGCLDVCTAKLFSGSFEAQYRCINPAIKFDIDAVKNVSEGEPDSRCKSAMLFLIDHLQSKKENNLKKISRF